MDNHQQRAWLLQSRINPAPLPGTLTLADARLSFTLDPECSPDALGWLERALGVEGIAAKLARGEPVLAFDYPIDECTVSWPITGGGATMLVRTPAGNKWVVSYDEPPGLGRRSAMLFTGRRSAREFKRALAEAGA